ncbi:MAG: fused MFS/spermidine synthase [Armatimonadota bacterium]
MPRPQTTLFAATIFLSAFLLFQIQPISARFVVPWFGGSAAVWTACLLFFQIVLLLGYLYAHGSIRFLKPRAQAIVHTVLLAVSALAFSLVPSPELKPTGTEEPVGRILLVLASTVGLKYFLLSTTGPLLQAWYAARQPGESYPYRLYALSNLGSMLALLGYPVIVEPFLSRYQQVTWWTGGYLLFAVLCAVIALTVPRQQAPTESGADDASTAPAPRFRQYAYWTFLAAVPSALLLGVTNHISQNIAAVPMLWILPLALYLLTFIICFGRREWHGGRVFLILPMCFMAAMAYYLLKDNQHQGIALLLSVFLGGLFMCCLLCHGELAHQKPPARYLTGFYLMMSLGGALGGVFVALIAPSVFNAQYELPLSIGACTLVALVALFQTRDKPHFSASLGSLSALTPMILYTLIGGAGDQVRDCRLSVRDFYGTLQIRDYGGGDEDPDAYRALTNGTILHGTQFLSPLRRREPTTYYAATSGVGRSIEATRRGPTASSGQRVGIIGLGTGTCAAYARPGDHYWYFEINPQVIDLARSQFTYLSDSPGKVETVLGDARLSLEKMPPLGLDVLAVDAFTSDSIPVHLLTREAFQTYFRHLKPGGILAVHVTNRYVRLQPVVENIARDLGKRAVVVDDPDGADSTGINTTEWVLVTSDSTVLSRQPIKDAAAPVESGSGLRTWSDDYSNLFQVLK